MRKLFLSLILFTASCASQDGIVRIENGSIEQSFFWYAPEAHEVCLAGEMCNWNPRQLRMNRDDNGYWSLKLLMPEGKWQYKFVVDGVWTRDTNNEMTAPDGYNGFNSVVVVGSVSDLGSDVVGVPHGVVTNIALFSRTLNAKTRVNIYLPPDYFNTNLSYPVLYMLHGYGEDETQWTRENNGAIQHFMDNLIYASKINPFIVVMPSGGKTFYTNQTGQFVADELYDYLTNRFRVVAGRERTAISGCSMGGFGAFDLALRFPERFGLSMPLSGYFDQNKYLRLFDNKTIRFGSKLILYCGSGDTLCYQTVNRLTKYLDRDGVVYEYRVSSGGHTWRYWNGITPEILKIASDFFYLREVEN